VTRATNALRKPSANGKSTGERGAAGLDVSPGADRHQQKGDL